MQRQSKNQKSYESVSMIYPFALLEHPVSIGLKRHQIWVEKVGAGLYGETLRLTKCNLDHAHRVVDAATGEGFDALFAAQKDWIHNLSHECLAANERLVSLVRYSLAEALALEFEAKPIEGQISKRGSPGSMRGDGDGAQATA